jgi:dihydroorotate dehydrogenase (NAD+) catalytic subunit
MGGVCSGRDALDLVAVGATAVALGTVLFSDPAAPARVRVELAGEVETALRGDASSLWATQKALQNSQNVTA